MGLSSGARARPEPRGACARPPARSPARPLNRPPASSSATGETGLRPRRSALPGTRAPTSTRARGGDRAAGARRGTRGPTSRAVPGRASAARRRARPPHSFTISRPRAPPSSPGIQTASRRRQPRILPPAPQPRSVHQYLAGRRAGKEGAPSKRLLLQPRHWPGALLPPTRRPTRRPSHRRRPLLSAFLASWPIRLLRGGGGFGKTHLRS